MIQRNFLRLDETAELLGVSIRFLVDNIAKKKLKAYKKGKRQYVFIADIEKFIKGE
jgi:excisionase family DNA binding protein